MNIVILMGRLTKDVDLKQSSTGKAYTQFSLAVDRPVAKGQDKQTDFINCKAFGKTAELLGKYFSKGNRVGVEGSLQVGSYVNKDGKTVYTTDVLVNRIHFIESRKSGDNQGFSSEDFGTTVMDEEIPF